MTERTCSRCDAKHYAKGLCRRHYDKASRDATNPNRRQRRRFHFPAADSMAEFILRRVEIDPATGCWLWFGSTLPHGYGQVSWQGVSTPAHRASYAEFAGPIPEGLELDHLCRDRACVNPDHLEPVTHAENMRRGVPATGEASYNGRKTHCSKGHPYSGDNLAVYSGRRVCRTCNIEYGRSWRAARSAA